MERFVSSNNYSHGQGERLGVLLVNLGTPAAPTASALRVYLRQFLSDPRVIETPRLVWWFILNLFILPRRSPRSAALYKKIWSSAGSPLLKFSRAQQRKLQRQFHSQPIPISVELAMSYGSPSIPRALNQLREKGMTHLLVLPLYPQYASSTTGSVFEALTQVLNKWRWIPHLRTIHSYHDEPLFIQELVRSIKLFQSKHGKPQLLIFSFHGIPLESLLNGDPYHCQCHKTARLVAEGLRLQRDEYRVCFQSRFGRQEWLQPYTDKTLESLPAAGIKDIQVVCPGFSSDCLETLEEIKQENRQLFIQAGGKKFSYIPCLNDSIGHISFLTHLIKRNLSDWLSSRQVHYGQRKKTRQLANKLDEQKLKNARSYQYS